VQEFIEGLSSGQLAGLLVGSIGALFLLGGALIKIAGFVINTVLRIVRSNTDRLNSSDIERATTRTEIKHLNNRSDQHEERITDLERK